jgi:hypothetical protein
MARARDFTRRHFRGALAASSIAMPTIVPSSVFGRYDKAAPGERITVGFIGCGKAANDYQLHELLRFGDVQALAVCEVDRTRREHAKRRVEQAYEGKSPSHVCDACSDFRDLVGRPSPLDRIGSLSKILQSWWTRATYSGSSGSGTQAFRHARSHMTSSLPVRPVRRPSARPESIIGEPDVSALPCCTI